MWEAHYDRSSRSGRQGYRYIETATAVALGSSGAAAMALRAACSGIEIQDHTHVPSKCDTSAALWENIPSEYLELPAVNMVYVRKLGWMRELQCWNLVKLISTVSLGFGRTERDCTY